MQGTTNSSLIKKSVSASLAKGQSGGLAQNLGSPSTVNFGLPPGWKREECTKQCGLGTGKSEIYYISPDGQKVRSKQEMRPILDDKHDLALFDWRSGKFAASLKSRRQEDTSESLSSKIARMENPHNPLQRRVASPESLTPVIIRSHPDCKRSDMPTSLLPDGPHQLFWEKGLAGNYAVCAETGDFYKPIKLPRGIQSAGVPGYKTPQLVQSLVHSLATKTSPITGQEQQPYTIEKNPCVAVNHTQPMVKTCIITDEDIRRQEARVKELRRKLEIARKRLHPRYATEREG